MVCGVRPVEVKEAAARPVVWRAWAFFEEADGGAELAVTGVGAVAETAEDLDREEVMRDMLSRLEARASGLMSGLCSFLFLAFKIAAPFPNAAVLTLFEGSFLSRCCSGVAVSIASFKYLKELRLRDSIFCGSCKVTISFLPKSSSVTRSLQFFALIFNRSTVS